MPDAIPLRFQPVFRRYLWGGRRLQTVLGKPIGEGQDYAESWEAVDHGEDQSVVANGPYRGRTLGELVASEREWLLGASCQSKSFPLLLKYLDCNRDLSVQVHPDDARAAQLTPPDLGKTEAWYILDARPGAKVYAGLKTGVDLKALECAIQAGEVEPLLHSFEPQAGDCIFIPAGAIHALGAGLLVAEIQQASDTTYRLFDWNRLDANGQPRALHVQQGLEASDFSLGPIGAVAPQADSDPRLEQLAACDKFVLQRITLDNDELGVGGDGRFHLVTVVGGKCQLENSAGQEVLTVGQTALIPAASGARLRASNSAVVLQAHLPD